MLTLTENATAEIRNILTAPEAPDGGGLRIANDPGAGGLLLSLAETPTEGDEVVEESGARVFLQPQVAVMLEDKTLDAGLDGDGRVRFALAD